MKKGFPRNRALIALVASLGVLLALYLIFTIYFSTHFFFHTEINGINVSCKTVKKTDELLAAEVQGYTLTLLGRNDVSDVITAEDIGLTYEATGDVANYLSAQNPFLWITSLFHSDVQEVADCTAYDENALIDRYKQLTFFDSENQKKPVNATVAYLDGQGYYMINEERGSLINEETFFPAVRASIASLADTLTLDTADCYVKPRITSDSKKLNKLYNKVQKMNQTEITYTFGKKSELLNGDTIHKWIKVNKKKCKANLDRKKISAYVAKLAKKYNTRGTKRTFQASTGHTATVYGGDYGWVINQDKEVQALTKMIKKGKQKNRTPEYWQKASTFGKKDWGNTFVEINLTAQHLWFYKKGKLVVESDFVSGSVRNNTVTPQGSYYILYRERDAILGARSNASYRTPVDFWMPFNGGIGLHDATWRRSFGGNIYLTNGSHGCVNLPYTAAQTIFENIETGTPVICYFDSAYQPGDLDKKPDTKHKKKA